MRYLRDDNSRYRLPRAVIKVVTVGPRRSPTGHQQRSDARGGAIMRMLWIVTIAVVLFATVSHANRANAAHTGANSLTAPSVMRATSAL